MAVVLHEEFFETLPPLVQVPREQADIAWLIYTLNFNAKENIYQLTLSEVFYTAFDAALMRIITPEPGPLEDFVAILQTELATALERITPEPKKPHGMLPPNEV